MIVVTMTSWIKRISNCYETISKLLNQSLKPDRIYLNLSTDEFPKKEDNLPSNLVKLLKDNDIFTINWVKENTKSMKKVFPILQYLNDDDLIINCDDDMDFPNDFIEVRVKEFVDNGGKNPISGSNNPRFHTNKCMFGNIYYNVICCTSIFQKKMLNGWDKIIDSSLIQTYNDDYLYTLLILMNGYTIIPTKKISTHSGIGPRKIKSLNDNDGLGKTHSYKGNSTVLLMFEKRYKDVFGCDFENIFHKKKYVIFDSFDKAGDNGEYFYEYMKDNHKDVSLSFIISNKSDDYERLKNKGYNVIDFYDSNIDDLLKDSTYIIFSKDIPGGFMNKLLPYRDKNIFLQHGVINSINNITSYMKYMEQFVGYMCCSSNKEIDVIKNENNVNNIKLLLTGLCRWDSLIRKDKLRDKNKRKNILISFHWRSGEIDKDINKFKKSQYLKSINELLNHPKVKQLCDENKCTVTFMYHARFEKYKEFFNIPDYICKGSSLQFQDMLVNSDVLITDFSSNAYEVSVINRPVLYFIPDVQYVKNNMCRYDVVNFEKYAIGKLHKSVDELIDSIDNILSNSYKYTDMCIKNINESIIFKDGKCCDRLYSELNNNEKKEYTTHTTSKKVTKIQQLREDIANGRVVKIVTNNGFIWKRVK